ncbi:MAG: hypothetical protein ACRDT2_14730 [Natronosporangium sp.]
MHVDLTTELFYGGTWNGISDRTYKRDPVRITRGIANEGGRSGPTSIGLSLDNRDGRFSVKHPASPLFGLLGRNAPIRVYVGTPHPSAANSDLADTTDHVAPSVQAPTGDGLLLCAWAAPQESDTYVLPASMTTVHSIAAPEVSFDVGGAVMAVGSEAIAAAGPTGTRTAVLGVAEDYVAASVLLHGTAPAIVDSSITSLGGFQTVSGLQVDDWLVVFGYFGWQPAALQPPSFPTDAREGGWILLADTGTLSPVDLDATFMRMKVWARRVRSAGDHRVMVDQLGRTFSSVIGVSGVGQWVLRGHAEVASMPPRREVSGRDRWVPVEAAGILRRLGASTAKPLRSALHRFTSRLPGLPGLPTPGSGLVRHWPLENDQVREGIPDRDIRLLALDEEPEFGPRPMFGADAGPPGTPRSMLMRPTHEVQFRASAADGWAVQLWLTPGDSAQAGPAGSWFVHPRVEGDVLLSWDHETGGIGLFLQDETGSSAGSDTDTFLPDGGPMLVTLFCGSNGSAVSATVNQLNTGAQVHLVVSGISKPFLINLGGVDVANSATFGVDDIQGRDVYVSHMAIGQHTTWQGNGEIAQQTLRAGAGHADETAGRRLLRLCAEENIPLGMIGDPDDTEMVGPQQPATLLELLHECETVDHGILHEPREALALAYRTRITLYNQPAAVTLDGASGELAMPWEPDPDDLLIRNDVAVTMPDGTQSRSVQETGPLNVSDPADSADGVGRYDVDIPSNVASRPRLPHHASWLRHLGTVDEPRFPSIAVSVLRELVLSGNQGLVDALARLDIGDRVVIVNPPDDLPPEDVQQLWVGSAETLTQVTWDLAGNTVPESPYHIAEVEHAEHGILQSDSATLAEALDTTETAVDINAGPGPDWVHEIDFGILVGGERMTVTGVGAMAGTFPNRITTLSVIRSVNGVIKAHNIAAPIEFFHKSYIGL